MRLPGFIEGLARWLAILGGFVLVVITAITVISIVGRGLISIGLQPIPGDFELVEVGTAFAIFAFLPWCQLTRGHATVDVFTSLLSARANRLIDLATELLMTAVLVLIAWRLWYGMLDKIQYNEVTFILQFPVWWGYAAAMVPAVAAVIVSVYVTIVRIQEVRTGRSILRPGQGVVH